MKYCKECEVITEIPYHRAIDDDEYIICKPCYDWNCAISRKGILTKEEIITNRMVNEEYVDTTTQYLQSIKKYIKANGYRPASILKRLLNREEYYAESMFKKSRSCLSFHEHLVTIHKVSEELSLFECENIILSSSDTDTWCGKLEIAYYRNKIKDLTR